MKILSSIRGFIKGIKNVVDWLPIIYNDRDWDHQFIFIILHKKLHNMEKFFDSDNVWGAKAKDSAKEIKLARILCERIIKHEYLSNATIRYDELYGDKEFMTLEKVEGKNYSRVKFTDDKNQQDMFDRACKHSDKMEKQDIEYLFGYLPKHIKKWWD